MIDVIKLTKIYKLKNKQVSALSDVSFTLKSGIGSLVGHNGAGKTTLIKILSTLVIPTSGDAFIEGHSVTREEKKVRELVGLVSVSERQFYYRLTAMENLLFFSSLQGLSITEAKKRAKEVLEMLNLSEWENVQYMKFSTGMQRKLALARALITDPPVILLDEPTLGLDPLSAREFRNVIKNFKDKTILFSSHYLKEVEELADKIILIKRGKIICEGNAEELKSKLGKVVEVKVREIPRGLERYAISLVGEPVLRLPEKETEKLKYFEDIREVEPTLDDVYAYMIGDEEDSIRMERVRRSWKAKE
ncbi:ABC transporter ATP-binding protein [Acidianus brierleyi]|uniref:ABC transporter ATP-binding protein n=1 Tax=Acidianus brierleyi TaxID=41673 RepID=A0A2U9IBA0_9CREN|nr:ABC transporter ATP-binding protein [Acidianus brierleyi]AWR93280.1 ATP-binding cassette domain-containing protein [Acidianus brierleyi]